MYLYHIDYQSGALILLYIARFCVSIHVFRDYESFRKFKDRNIVSDKTPFVSGRTDDLFKIKQRGMHGELKEMVTTMKACLSPKILWNQASRRWVLPASIPHPSHLLYGNLS